MVSPARPTHGLGQAPLGGGASDSPFQGEGLAIEVRVYDYVGVPAGILAQAERHATYILAKAGVETTWLDCRSFRPEGAVVHTAVACEQDLSPTDFMLRLLSQPASLREGFSDETLGFAPLSSKTGHGYLASVFYLQVRDLAAQDRIDVATVMGCAVAHEIGHLLLGPNAHSPGGIMRAHWRRADLQLADQRGLLFTPQESERIRVRWERMQTRRKRL